MKSVLIISFSNLKRDPRVFKQIDFFSKRFQLTTMGYAPSGHSNVTHLQVDNTAFDLVSKLKYLFYIFTFQYAKALLCFPNIKKAFAHIEGHQYDMVIANDSYAWPVAFKIKKPTRIICDAHEYAPKEFEDKLKWRLLFQKINYYLCKTYLPKADYVLTVGEEIALEYQKEFGIAQPIVIMNVPPYSDIKPTEPQADALRLIHHGNAVRSRKLENMINMMNHLDDRFELNLMLVESDFGYLDELKEIALKTGKKINFLTPVTLQEIVPFISKFDIGVYILEPVSFNNRFALPNKIFEFIQARLAIAIGPSPEMANIVKQHNIGWVSKDFTSQSLAEKLAHTNRAEIHELKANATAAAQTLCFENEFKKFDLFL